MAAFNDLIGMLTTSRLCLASASRRRALSNAQGSA
jgi:hypothetical protein